MNRIGPNITTRFGNRRAKRSESCQKLTVSQDEGRTALNHGDTEGTENDWETAGPTIGVKGRCRSLCLCGQSPFAGRTATSPPAPLRKRRGENSSSSLLRENRRLPLPSRNGRGGPAQRGRGRAVAFHRFRVPEPGMTTVVRRPPSLCMASHCRAGAAQPA